MRWKRLARNKWVARCSITESSDQEYNGPGVHHRFTATINGFQNWRIWIGKFGQEQKLDMYQVVDLVITKVKRIRDCIDNDDETIWDRKQAW